MSLQCVLLIFATLSHAHRNQRENCRIFRMPFMTNFQNVLSSVKKKSVLVYPKIPITQ
jgi:hypothetical protein